MDDSLSIHLARLFPQYEATSGVDSEALQAHGLRLEWLLPETWRMEPSLSHNAEDDGSDAGASASERPADLEASAASEAIPPASGSQPATYDEDGDGTPDGGLVVSHQS